MKNLNSFPTMALGKFMELYFGERITKSESLGSKYPVYGGGGNSFVTDKYNRKNEYIISRFAMSTKCVRYVKGKFWLLDSGASIRVKEVFQGDLSIQYIGLALTSKQRDILACARGAAQKNMDTKIFYKIKVPIPTLKEQKEIAAFLDKKISQIDTLVSNIENKIDLLKEYRIALINQYVTKGLNPKAKMKDSGVTWLGKTPKHWQTIRLNNIGNFWKCKNITNGDLVDSGMPVILYSHVYTSYNRVVTKPIFFISEELDSQAASITKGDFLFTSSGESVEDIGKCILYDGDKEISVGGDVSILSLYPKNDFDRHFLSFVFNSNYVSQYKSSNARGEIIVHIYSKQLKNIYIAVPPKVEQLEIARKLVVVENTSDKLIEKYHKKIQLLKEYRESLISNVVTGKVRITKDML